MPRRRILFVGMDLFPPYNEIASKTVYTLVRGMTGNRAFRALSFSNPLATMEEAPGDAYVSVPGRGAIASALGLVLALARELFQQPSIVHFVMPARHRRFVALLLAICRLRGAPTVFTLLKNRAPQILTARGATALVAQTRPAYERAASLVDSDKVHFIPPGSTEQVLEAGGKRGKCVLFIGIPWKKEDLDRRGVYLFFDVVRRTLELDGDVHFTLLNRALPNAGLVDELAASIPAESLSVHHGSVERISHWYARHSAFLILHKDDQCPDPPLSAVEACACGCAVVTTRFNGLAGDIAEAGAGVVEDVEPGEIARGILRVLDDEQGFRKRALRLSEESFSEKKFCSRYYDLYDRLDLPG